MKRRRYKAPVFRTLRTNYTIEPLLDLTPAELARLFPALAYSLGLGKWPGAPEHEPKQPKEDPTCLQSAR